MATGHLGTLLNRAHCRNVNMIFNELFVLRSIKYLNILFDLRIELSFFINELHYLHC
jgi:hypothetical protein